MAAMPYTQTRPATNGRDGQPAGGGGDGGDNGHERCGGQLGTGKGGGKRNMLGGTRVVVGDYCAVAGAPTQAHTPASPPHVVGWKNGAQAPPSLNRHAGMCGRGSSSGSDARRTCRSICCRTTCATTRFPTLTARHPPGRAPATREEQSSPGILAQGGKRQRCPLPPPPAALQGRVRPSQARQRRGGQSHPPRLPAAADADRGLNLPRAIPIREGRGGHGVR